MEGHFSLQVSPNAVLVVSYIGYIDQTIPVDGKNSLTVLLGKEDSQFWMKWWLWGYGQQKKVNMSAAVSVDKEQDGRQPSDHIALSRTCRYGSRCFRNSR